MDQSEEQMAEWKGAFALFDKNGKGAISVKELSDVMKALDQSPNEAQLKKIVTEFDVDGNGQIDFSDFVQIMSKHGGGEVSEEEQLKEVFRVFDKNGDGYITPDKLKQVLMAFGQSLSDEDIAHLMSLADFKGEGKVDFEVFCDIIKPKKQAEAPS